MKLKEYLKAEQIDLADKLKLETKYKEFFFGENRKKELEQQGIKVYETADKRGAYFCYHDISGVQPEFDKLLQIKHYKDTQIIKYCLLFLSGVTAVSLIYFIAVGVKIGSLLSTLPNF